MDVVIYTGDLPSSAYDSIGWKVAETLVTALLSLGAAWYVAHWVFRKERSRELQRERDNLQALSTYFFAVVESLREPLAKQLASVRRLIVDLRKQEDRELTFELIAALNFNRVLTIDQTTLFRAVVSNEPGNHTDRLQAYSMVMEQIDYLMRVRESHVEYFDVIATEQTKRHEEWGSNLGQIMHLLNGWVAEKLANKTTGNDPMLLKIQILRVGVFKADAKRGERSDHLDMYRLIESFIKPLLDILNDYPHDERSAMLAHPAEGCLRAWEITKHMKETYSSHFQRDVQGSESAVTKLYNALSVLK